MEENREIDDFDLGDAKRNMAKMLSDAQNSAGMRKIFGHSEVSEVFRKEEPNNNGQTINIYPGQGQMDQNYMLQEFIQRQTRESEQLKQEISNLTEVQKRLTGLEVVLKQLMQQQNNLISPPEILKRDSRTTRYTIIGLIALTISFLFFVGNDRDQIQAKRSPAIVNAKTVESESYVSLKFVNVRDIPSVNKGKVALMVPPNQVMQVLSKKGNWFEVEYMDHLKNQKHHGWVYGEFIKKIN